MKRVIKTLDRVRLLVVLWKGTLGRREATVILTSPYAQFVSRAFQAALFSNCCLSSGCFAMKGGRGRAFLEMLACFATCFVEGKVSTEAGEDGSKRRPGKAIA